MNEQETRLKRLLYQSWHRGCKETDQLLGHFARGRLSELDEGQLNTYESLINEDDWDIYAWLTNANPTPEKYQALLEMVLEFNRETAAK